MNAICKYCGATFEPPKPTTVLCRGCWYDGALFEEQHAALLARLRAIAGVDRAEIEHTGGGCFGLGVRLASGHFLFGTEAYQDDDGAWSCDVGIPAPGDPWGVGLYLDDELSNEAVEMHCPLTDDQFVALVVAGLKDLALDLEGSA